MNLSVVQNEAETTIRVVGRLDAYWSGLLERELAERVRGGADRLCLDLSGVPFLSSAGIRVIPGQHRQLSRIKGSLRVAPCSPEARNVLELAGLSALLTAPAPASSATTGVTVEARGVTFTLWKAGGTAGTCRVIGTGTELGSGKEAFVPHPVPCGQATLALGLGALGNNPRDCRERPGEFLGAGGAGICLPGDGTRTPDYLIGSGDKAADACLMSGLVATGKPTLFASFRMPERPVGLSQLAEAALELSGARVAALAFLANTEGLVGASLLKAPEEVQEHGFFTLPEARDRISFTPERVFRRALALGVGFVAEGGGDPGLMALLRPLDAEGRVPGHFHAAAFPFRPFPAGPLDLGDCVRRLLEESQILGVCHLLNDPRPVTGAGESAFSDGCLWIVPVEHGATGGATDKP